MNQHSQISSSTLKPLKIDNKQSTLLLKLQNLLKIKVTTDIEHRRIIEEHRPQPQILNPETSALQRCNKEDNFLSTLKYLLRNPLKNASYYSEQKNFVIKNFKINDFSEDLLFQTIQENVRENVNILKNSKHSLKKKRHLVRECIRKFLFFHELYELKFLQAPPPIHNIFLELVLSVFNSGLRRYVTLLKLVRKIMILEGHLSQRQANLRNNTLDLECIQAQHLAWCYQITGQKVPEELYRYLENDLVYCPNASKVTQNGISHRRTTSRNFWIKNEQEAQSESSEQSSKIDRQNGAGSKNKRQEKGYLKKGKRDLSKQIKEKNHKSLKFKKFAQDSKLDRPTNSYCGTNKKEKIKQKRIEKRNKLHKDQLSNKILSPEEMLNLSRKRVQDKQRLEKRRRRQLRQKKNERLAKKYLARQNLQKTYIKEEGGDIRSKQEQIQRKLKLLQKKKKRLAKEQQKLTLQRQKLQQRKAEKSRTQSQSEPSEQDYSQDVHQIKQQSPSHQSNLTFYEELLKQYEDYPSDESNESYESVVEVEYNPSQPNTKQQESYQEEESYEDQYEI